MKQCIRDPEEVNWSDYWKEKLKSKKDAKKDWNKAASKFHERAKRDDYHELLFSRLKITKEDTVLDLGCGEGSLTIPIAEMAKHVTGVDSSYKMLELLDEKVEKEGIGNIDTILKDIEEIDCEELGNYDVVIASRSLNSIENIEKTIETIDKIANKYVFITYFGPDNWKIEKDFYKYIDKEYNAFPDYNYLFNIIFNLGIYPNVERMDIKKYRRYKSVDEAMTNGKFRPQLLSSTERDKLREYLEKTFKRDSENGTVFNEIDKADWILFWWKK